MAMERISMSKIREVLRLKLENGLSNHEISESCHVSRRTISKYLEAATANGVDWSIAKDLGDAELMEKLLKNHSGQNQGATLPGIVKPMPDWAYIQRELKRRHVTLILLWQEYKEAHPDGYQQSQFGELYRQWRGKLNISMRQDHRAGEKGFVDYCDGISIVNRSTGEIIPTELFVSVWGASNYTYAEASFTQNKRDWTMSHVRSFEYFGCVPHIVILDNLKSGVTRACRYEPTLNATYLELSQHYGFCAIPARPRHPKDKAKVEGGVLIAQRWILACLRNRTFYSLAELNEAIGVLLERLNTRQMQKLKRTRKELFEEIDKPAALPLVSQRYEYAEWKKARVNIDYHVEVDGHYYSAPYQLIHEEIDVKLGDNVVELLYKGKRVASHARSFEKHRFTRLPEHMPESHRKYMEWNPTRIIAWAGKIGPSTQELVKIVLESKYPELGYRTCLGIFRLSKGYERERIENACKRAVRYRTLTYKSIESILDNNLDKQVDLFDTTTTTEVSPMHDNVRGTLYYRADEDQPEQLTERTDNAQ